MHLQPDGVPVGFSGLGPAGLAHVSPDTAAEVDQLADIGTHRVGDADDHLEIRFRAGDFPGFLYQLNISGGVGRDILIGGAGNDQLDGGADDDILIGGTTSFDANDQALKSLLSEWTSGRSFADRQTNLSQGTGDILQGTGFKLVQGTTVFSAGNDKLTGGSGDNLFFPQAGNVNRNNGKDKGKGKQK